MKKIVSLFILTMAITPLCGMEQSPITLPQDVQNSIIEFLNQGESPTSIINSILATSCTCSSLHETIYSLHGIGHLPLIKTNAIHDTPYKFHNLVHELADKFDTATGEIIKEIKAPIFQRYFNLFVKFQHAVMDLNPDINQVKHLIEQGADVNGSGPGRVTPLMQVIPFCNCTPVAIDLVKLLLNHKANPDAINDYGHTMIDCSNVIFNLETRKHVTQLLEDARKNYKAQKK